MNRYLFLIWPHANPRYREESVSLAEAELRVLLQGFDAGIEPSRHLNLPCLTLCADAPLGEAQLRAIGAHSLLYGLYRVREDGALTPVAGRAPALLGEDLPGILKYKGKTNEYFTQMLINLAWYSGAYAGQDGIRLLDPMCGKATALFVGANRGWDCAGTDVSRAELKEAEQFFKRYLEYHKIRHSLAHRSLTVSGRGAPCAVFEVPEPAKGGTIRLRLAEMDGGAVRGAFGAKAFHIVAADLPYGVQHGAKGGSLTALLSRMLPAWRDALAPGGTVALSFNANTLPLDAVREQMAKAGLKPLTGGAYDRLRHWVEQAVTRDAAVAVKA